MRHSFLTTCLLFLLSCSPNKNLLTSDLTGKYQGPEDMGINYTITLNEDSTFEYFWKTGLHWGTTNGTWIFEQGNLTLNSDLQPEQTGQKYNQITLTDTLGPYEFFSNELWRARKGKLKELEHGRTYLKTE